MSPLRRRFLAAAVGVALLTVAAGCSERRDASPFDPEGGHPDDWVAQHPAAYRSDSESCRECHGANLTGGISKVSCATASFEGQRCHAGGPGGRHPAGWGSPGLHGSAAKGAPGTMSGFLACEACHGTNFDGGSVRTSCFPCHGWNAPHGRSGWDGGGSSHRSTDQGNAGVCAQCHRRGSGTPGCFNNTLCHGQGGGHPPGWSNPGQHGPAARNSPGFPACQSCHGSGFTGGSAGQSCFPCHGWSAPHGRSGWSGGGSLHRTTNRAYASVCAQCHRRNSGTPGCFNNTLCHGADD